MTLFSCRTTDLSRAWLHRLGVTTTFDLADAMFFNSDTAARNFLECSVFAPNELSVVELSVKIVTAND